MAANTDKLRKGVRRFTTTIGTGGVTDGVVTTIPLTSVLGIPTDTAVDVSIDRVDPSGNLTLSKEEVVTGVVSGTNLVTCLRGVEGTAQAHSAGAVVEIRLTSAQWNSQIDAILTEHNQDGTHTSAFYSALDAVIAAYVDPAIAAAISASEAATEDKIYPVGSIYINAAVATNPGTLLGFGTWVAFGAGRAMVGLNGSDADFDTAEETGGAKTHTLSEAEMPVHTHIQNAHSHTIAGDGSDGNANYLQVSDRLGGYIVTSNAATATNQNAGSGTAHNNLQPYIVVYMWKRTA